MPNAPPTAFGESSGWFDPFTPLAPEARQMQRAACLALLRERDGEIDFAHRRLSRREAWFDALDCSALWRGTFDRDRLVAALRGGPRDGLDPRTLWLYAACRADESESYGVEIEIRRFLAQGSEQAPEDELYLILEEQYHGRILREVCRACGVEFEFPPPRRGVRALIHLFEYLPDPLRYVGVLCGEVLGSTVFQVLWENTRLFESEPAIAAHLRSLMAEILRDELLHVAFCQTRLGPLGMQAARRLLPAIATYLMSQVPELAALGCDRRELSRRLRAPLPLPPGLPASSVPLRAAA